MEPHRDDDAAKGGLAELGRLAAEMTERGENRITAGLPGEAPLAEWRARGLTVRKMPDDRWCLAFPCVSLRSRYCARGSARTVFSGETGRRWRLFGARACGSEEGTARRGSLGLRRCGESSI